MRRWLSQVVGFNKRNLINVSERIIEKRKKTKNEKNVRIPCTQRAYHTSLKRNSFTSTGWSSQLGRFLDLVVMCLISLVRCVNCEVVSRPAVYNPKTLTAAVIVSDVLCNNSSCQRIASALRFVRKHGNEYSYSDCTNPTCTEEFCRLEVLPVSCLDRWALSPDNFLPIRTSLYLPGKFIYLLKFNLNVSFFTGYILIC